MQLGTILVPVDGSEHSMRAVHYAAGLARLGEGAKLVLLHCHKPVPLTLGEPNFQQALDALGRESEGILMPYRRALQEQGVAFEEKVVGGSAAQVIADVAENLGCGLVVMGSKGKSDLEGLIVGSVTHKVLHIASCPVLVVR